MARTLGCADIGYDCVFRVTTEDGDDDLILDTAVAHAKKHHPEISADEMALREKLRSSIRSLLDQSGYHKSPTDRVG